MPDHATIRDSWKTRPMAEQVKALDAHRAALISAIADLQFDSVLEFGCGAGQNLQAISRLWLDVEITGIDVSPARLDRARTALQKAALRLGDESAISGQFDLVLSDAVCLIYPDPQLILDAIWRSARRYLVLSEWNLAGRGSFRPDIIKPCDYYVHDYAERLGQPMRTLKYLPEHWPSERCDHWHAYGQVMVWEKAA